MADSTTERDPFELLAEEFIGRLRRGENPTAEEYAVRHPEIADRIRSLFPTVAALEQVRLRRGESGGPPAAAPPRLERLGDLRILREIGRGGMGIVYEAEQESLRRRVAVKVLLSASLLDEHRVRRFEREAQTAARLHHTNIVPVFGFGSQGGLHYYVMQVIVGAGLDTVIARLKQPGGAAPHGPATARPPRAGVPTVSAGGDAAADAPPADAPAAAGAGGPGNHSEYVVLAPGAGETGRPAGTGPSTFVRAGLPPRPAPEGAGAAAPAAPVFPGPGSGNEYWKWVARIGVQLADALQYAHSQGTLHRDIKPANILLDPEGTPWITDFGLAKALEHEDITRTGNIVGTLQYMPPEQLRGEYDRRGDIYSLGLTLYELLTLQPAFSDHSQSGLIRKINTADPVPPRKLNRAVPRDLETVILKSMARDRGHRYQTAQELHDDLARFLEDRPIRARRVTVAERLWRWCRRNPLVAGSAVVAAASLLLALVISLVSGFRTREALGRETQQRQRAEETSALAVEALEEIFQQLAPERVVSALELTVESDGETIEVPVYATQPRETAALLARLLVFYDRLAAQDAGDLTLRQQSAKANRRVGDILGRLGDFDKAEAAYGKALALYRELAGQPGGADLLPELAGVHNALGSLYWKALKWREGWESHLAAIGILRRSPEFETSPRIRYELARTYYYLGRKKERYPDEGPGRPDAGPGGPFQGPPWMTGRWGSPGFQGRGGPGGTGKGGSGAKGKEPSGPGGQPGPGERGKNGPPGDRGKGGPPGDRGKGGQPGEGGKNGPPGDKGKGGQGYFGGRRPPGEEYIEQALQILAALAKEYPNVPAYRHLQALAYREHAAILWREDPAKSLQSANRAIALLRELATAHPDVPDYRYHLSDALSFWDVRGLTAEGERGRVVEENLTQALQTCQKLVGEYPNVADYQTLLPHIHYKLGTLQSQHNRSEDAEEHFQKAVMLQKQLVRRFPSNIFYKFWRATFQLTLARELSVLDRLEEARKVLESSVKEMEASLEGEQRPDPLRFLLRESCGQLAAVCRGLGDEESAAAAAAQADRYRFHFNPWMGRPRGEGSGQPGRPGAR